ncbi:MULTISPECIES: hypothetical protein [Clostridium]|uniref:Membrane-spanning protein n=1 Tax=Clostridium ragsdalei P11 TaxID=1353534 RepID=A0A1A6AJZ6_9CLOT|nr:MULTISPECIES: hypothetical protein [Clostridium]OBR90402.1 hypothetical protein CLRAG_35800 [Clostridium ragsdalei P11]QXE18204.1 hypothetical protein B5S50_04755 [Clostridium sp. 001]
MNMKNNKLSTILVVFLEILLVVTSIISVVSGQWKNFLLCLLTIICLTLPFIITYIANKKEIVLPSNFQLVTLIFIFLAQYLGQIKKLYFRFWWWDLFLHIIFGSYTVIIGLYYTQGIIRKDEKITKQRFTLFTVIFAFSFSITLGTLWEMFEFIGDYLFETSMVKGGLEDTATDLIVKVLAALITSIIYYFRNLKK